MVTEELRATCTLPGLHSDSLPGRLSHLTAMAPLSLPLSCLLRHRECLHRTAVFCSALQGSHQRPVSSSSRSWRRSFGSVPLGVGPLLSRQQLQQQPQLGAPVCRSSSSSHGQDMTERLWSVYNQTKKQTQGRNSENKPHGDTALQGTVVVL